MINVADESQFCDYLKNKQLITNLKEVSIQQLGGGVSCETIIVRSPERSFVVKQALAKLRVKEDWFSDVTRVITEKDGLAFYNTVVPEYTPELLFYDEENYLYGMEAAPDSSRMWKDMLLAGNIDFAVARKVASALAKVHKASAYDLKIQQRFKSQKFFIELRVEPYLETIAKRHPVLEKIIHGEIKRLLGNKQVLVHGDFSPKNILVNGTDIFILDFEVAHIGDPSFDVGFLTNHFLLKAIKNKQWMPSYLNLAQYTMDTYAAEIDFMDPKILEYNTVKTLALLFLSRVDGKSPAEYITGDTDKNLIRKISYGILQNDIRTYRQMIAYFLTEVEMMG